MAETDAICRFDEEGGYCVIALLPELNKAPWGDIDSIGTSLLQRMEEKMSAGRQRAAFLVDLSALHYIGSAMVALVVRLWKATKGKNARMAVVNNDENVLEVLRLSGLEKVWTIVDTREAALKALGISPRPVVPENAGTAGQAESSPAAAASSRCAGMWAATSLCFLLVSAAGLYLFAARPNLIKDGRITQGMLYIGGLVSVIAGTAAASLARRLPRTLGATCLLGSLALLGTGVFVHPAREALLQAPVEKKEQPAGEINGQNPGKSPGARGGGKHKPVEAPRPRSRKSGA